MKKHENYEVSYIRKNGQRTTKTTKGSIEFICKVFLNLKEMGCTQITVYNENKTTILQTL